MKFQPSYIIILFCFFEIDPHSTSSADRAAICLPWLSKCWAYMPRYMLVL